MRTKKVILHTKKVHLSNLNKIRANNISSKKLRTDGKSVLQSIFAKTKMATSINYLYLYELYHLTFRDNILSIGKFTYSLYHGLVNGKTCLQL